MGELWQSKTLGGTEREVGEGWRGDKQGRHTVRHDFGKTPLSAKGRGVQIKKRRDCQSQASMRLWGHWKSHTLMQWDIYI